MRFVLPVLLLMTGCHGKNTSSGAVQTKNFQARLVNVEGVVHVDGNIANEGTPLAATAKVETGPAGRAVLALAPGSIVALRPNSRVQLGKSTRKDVSLQLLAGAAWSMFASNSSYEVVTDTAVAGVRGTAFYVEARPGGSYVCTCNGEVELTEPKGGAFRQVVTSPNSDHKGFMITNVTGSAVASALPRSNHSDTEAEVLQSFQAKAH